MMPWDRIQDLFPVNDHLIWLNSCGTNPICDRSLQAVKAFLDDYSRFGVLGKSVSYSEIKDRILSSIAKLIGCQKEDLAVIHNTAEGMLFLSLGFDLQAGDEILLLENEYPSNVYPWQHWTKKGVILKTVLMADTPDQFLENFIQSLSPRTRVAAMSLVHWCTGMPLPIAAMAKYCRQQDIQLVLDGAQGVGLIDVHVQDMDLDYMAFPAWKWLLGPLGLGCLYIRQQKLDKLHFDFKATSSVLNEEQYLPYQQTVKPSTDRYCFSTPNFNDWVYFAASLDLLEEIGFSRVQKRIVQLGDILAAGLQRLGFTIVRSAFADQATGIVSVQRQDIDSKVACALLKDQGIICAERLGFLRFAPHIHISEKQLDKVLEIIEQNF